MKKIFILLLCSFSCLSWCAKIKEECGTIRVPVNYVEIVHLKEELKKEQPLGIKDPKGHTKRLKDLMDALPPEEMLLISAKLIDNQRTFLQTTALSYYHDADLSTKGWEHRKDRELQNVRDAMAGLKGLTTVHEVYKNYLNK